jgi:predicted nucleic acid-binding protein
VHLTAANARRVQQRGNSQGGNKSRVRTTIDAWRAVLPVQGTEDDDLSAALDAVKNNRLAFWDAMLWAAAQRAGVRHLVTEDLQDGFELAGVRFVNPFEAANNGLIDEILPLG